MQPLRSAFVKDIAVLVQRVLLKYLVQATLIKWVLVTRH